MTFFAWLATTRIGRWAAGLFALLAAFVGVALTAFLKGKRTQATQDKAKDAEATQRAAQAAQQTFTAASDAATKVQADAAKQAAPNTVKRDDFDTSF